MFYGTSKALQLAGRPALSSPLQQRLFSAFRVLEANRAILYGDVTFLSEHKWRLHHCTGNGHTGPPDFMATMTELLIETSAFSKHGLFEQVEPIPEDVRLCNLVVTALARRGHELNQILNAWYDGNAPASEFADPFTQLALANFYAVRLFHCNNFTYYTCWEAGTVPQLDKPEIDAYVAIITDLCDQILQTSNIPGAILLFPLRMAGAHARYEPQRYNVRHLLHQIHNNGFVVAQRIQTDVSELWQYQAGNNLDELRM
ncbi:hypothetical protein BBK36DRAFT_1131177 [Trichoderma citrinoviride]|uniref:Uncharacterized protein n=1 Tax=Trichoderma citrinoviride TaxID=58853 RepID=A0A2T4AX92_9HYPO|nr:hypothetical protein BBK36DRAFT_1131177 [Trichoderma citrinoviride]PTB61695.1 hypothetical protein BBK36DRAFT_1131177 [Trichoderma citrinoviride]